VTAALRWRGRCSNLDSSNRLKKRLMGRIRASAVMLGSVLMAVVCVGRWHSTAAAPDSEAMLALAKTDMRSIATALDLYRLDNLRYPTTAEGLKVLLGGRPIRRRSASGTLVAICEFCPKTLVVVNISMRIRVRSGARTTCGR
jgi:Type II secretion system (T2SS), protein G